MANRYISIKQILDDTLDHPLLRDLSFERAVNHVVHFIRLIGMPDIFEERTERVPIDDYRGKLPCDLESIIQVRVCGGIHDNEVLRYTTDTFHMSDKKSCSYDLTYKVQNTVIYTSLKKGTIEIAYRGFAVDDEGYPLIPDDSSFIQALEFYIKKKHFTTLFDQGKITPQVYNQVLQDYAFYAGQAQTSLIRPSIDQMQSFANSLNTLIPRMNEHARHFVNNGSMEKLKRH